MVYPSSISSVSSLPSTDASTITTTFLLFFAYARAAYRMNKEGMSGAMTVFDVAPKYISPMSNEEMRRKLL